MPPPKTSSQINQAIRELPNLTQGILNRFLLLQPTITCTYCTHAGTTQYVGNSTLANQIKPIFECSNCGKNPILTNIEREITQAASQSIPISIPISNTNVPTPATPKKKPGKKRARVTSNASTATITQPSTQPSSDQSDLLVLIKQLEARLTEVEKSKHQLELQCQQLTHKNTTLQQQLTDVKKHFHLKNVDDLEMNEDNDEINHETPAITPFTFSLGTAASKWANAPAAVTTAPTSSQNSTNNNHNNTQKNKKNNKTTKKNSTNTKQEIRQQKQQQQQEAIAAKKLRLALRQFEPVQLEDQGFEYIYYPTRNRVNRRKHRQTLADLGVDNGRILDIHYPSKTIAAFLIHKLYKQELINTLKTVGLQNLEYNPCDANSLTNPDYNNLSEEEKSNIATEKHNARLVRALPHIRKPVSKAVAKFFHAQNWITETQLEEFMIQYNATSDEKKGKNKMPTTAKTNTTNIPPSPPKNYPTIDNSNSTPTVKPSEEDLDNDTSMENATIDNHTADDPTAINDTQLTASASTSTNTTSNL